MEGFTSIDAPVSPKASPKRVAGGAKPEDHEDPDKPQKRHKKASNKLVSKTELRDEVSNFFTTGKDMKQARLSAAAISAIDAWACDSLSAAVSTVSDIMRACNDKHESISAHAIANVLKDCESRLCNGRTSDVGSTDLVKITKVAAFARAPSGGKSRRLRSETKETPGLVLQKTLSRCVACLLVQSWEYTKAARRSTIMVNDVAAAVSNKDSRIATQMQKYEEMRKIRRKELDRSRRAADKAAKGKAAKGKAGKGKAAKSKAAKRQKTK